jgi:hypothetical protein
MFDFRERRGAGGRIFGILNIQFVRFKTSENVGVDINQPFVRWDFGRVF